MQKPIKYAIFRTKWGYFGLAGTEDALCRTHLPEPEPEKLKSHLLKSLPLECRVSSIEYRASSIEFDKTFFKTIQEQIVAYFDCVRVNFSPDIPLSLDGFGCFFRSVLTASRRVTFGQTITYAALAKKVSCPRAARAVGNALAANPLPLIIPCHRVIRSDGKIGGFSAFGGKDTKTRLLRHENAVLVAFKNA